MPNAKLWNRNFSLMMASMLCSNFSMAIMSTSINAFVISLGYSVSIAGLVTSVLAISAMCARPFTGGICDRGNQKQIYILSSIAMMVTSAGCAMTSSDAMLIILRILFGISISFLSTVSMAMLVNYMPAERTTEGYGLMTVTQVGAFSVGPILSLSIASQWGYRYCLLLAAVFSFCTIIPLFFLQYDDAGREKPRLSVKGFVRGMFVKEALPFMLIMVAVTTISSIENNYLALYALEYNVGNASVYFMISAVVLFAIRIFAGKYIGRFRFYVILLYGASLSAAAFALLGYISAGNAMTFIIIAAVLKATAVSILRPVLQSECMSAVPANRRGAASSTLLLGVDAAYGFTPLISAAIYPSYGYRGVFLYCIVPIILSAAIYGIWHTLRIRSQRLEA